MYGCYGHLNRNCKKKIINKPYREKSLYICMLDVDNNITKKPIPMPTRIDCTHGINRQTSNESKLSKHKRIEYIICQY